MGTVIDPMADKTLMTVGVVCLAIRGDMPSMPIPSLLLFRASSQSGPETTMLTCECEVWLAGLILARDVGLAIAAIYYRWISLPPPKTMARYWDFSLPSAEVHPTGVSKVNTALQLLLVGASMAVPVLGDDGDRGGDCGGDGDGEV